MKKLSCVFVCNALVLASFGQMPLPCLQYFEQDQIAAWHGIMHINCIDVNMYENTATIADDQLRTYYVQEGGIHPGTGQGVAILPNDTPNSKFEMLLEEHNEQHVEGAWYYPATSYNVELFRKTEWGLKLPAEIQVMVDNWISNDENGTNLQPAINPFDPDVIDVWAEVWEPGKTVYQPVFGFYYRDYERIYEGHNPQNLPGMDDPDNWYWNEIPNAYDFRFRFAPKVDGLHFVTLHVEVEGFEPFVSDVFSFRTLSGDPARSPLKKSPNGHYYVTSADNKVFFPVGQNINAPYLCNCNDFDTYVDPEQDDIQCASCYLDDEYDICCGLNANNRSNHWMAGATVRQKTLPMANYIKFNQTIEALHEAGANTFRTMPFPIAFDIEFEKLNNYNERQFMAWEFDQVLNTTDALGMRIQYNMLNHMPLGIGHTANWDWQSFTYTNLWNESVTDGGFCYSTCEGLLNPEPTSFLTSATAKNAYKKKIRYVMARFGYACNYTHMELVSEINNIGARTNWLNEKNKVEDEIAAEGDSSSGQLANLVYLTAMVEQSGAILNYNANHAVIGQQVEDWHIEMAQYIKSELSIKHILIGADYAGVGPMLVDSIGFDSYTEMCESPAEFRDHSWYQPIIDVLAFSNYSADPMGTFSKNVDLIWGQIRCSPNDRPTIHNPVVCAETGANGLTGDVEDTFFYKNLWSNAFGGYASSGLEWTRNAEVTRWATFGKVSEFVNSALFDKEGVLNTEDWQPGYALSNGGENGNESHLYETVYMKKSVDDHQHIVGAIFNRTWNPYTTWQYKPGIPDSHDTTDVYQDTFQAYYILNGAFLDLNSYSNIVYDNDDAIRFDGMQLGVPYIIRYFDAQTLINIKTVGLNSNLFTGKLKLAEFPSLTISNPIVLYTVDRADFQSMDNTPTNDMVSALDIALSIKELQEAMTTVDLSGMTALNQTIDEQWMPIKLLNVLGQEVECNLINDLPIPKYDLANGIYFVVLQNQNQVKTLKIQINHE